MNGLSKLFRFCLVCCCIAAATIACSSDDEEPIAPDTPEENTTEPRTQVNILSRAENNSGGNTLQAGLYMVNYIDGHLDELLPANNYVNNQLLTWKNNAWTTATPIYWNDMETRADFYAYAPYQATVSNARQMPFSVKNDQRTTTAFEQSDLMWGTAQGQSPSDETFDLILTHLLSSLTVNVIAEAGFDDSELKASDVSVTIGGTKTTATIDLQTGTAVALGGSPADVVCHNNGDLSYTAILLPQQVPFSNLIQVDWKGNKYTLQNSFTLDAKRQYTLTVKLKKTKSGFDIGIEGWDILPEDFGGTIGG